MTLQTEFYKMWQYWNVLWETALSSTENVFYLQVRDIIGTLAQF